MDTIIPLYRSACPVCGGDATSANIELHGSCEKCATNRDSVFDAFRSFIANSEEEFAEFFEKITGFRPWGAQRHWLRRLLRGENTVLIAPTGVGKTTLLIAYALYSATKGKKVLYVAPTKSLMNQTYRKIEEYARKAKLSLSTIVCYDSSQSKKKREALLEQIKSCNFELLIITGNFLLRKHEILLNCKPNIVVVDDVDSLIKSEKSTYSLIKLLGYSEKSIELAKRKINLLWKILFNRAHGKNVDELVKEFIELDRELESELASARLSQLVVASATGRSRGIASKLLRDLLKVDLSGITIYGRNITDSFVLVNSPEELINVVLNVTNTLGKGCILYISPHHPLREVYESFTIKILKELEKSGLKVAGAKPKAVAEFTKGVVDVLLGYSTYYGVSVRGIDAPMHTKYVIFLGVPIFAVTLENFLAKLNMLSRTIAELAKRRSDLIPRELSVEVRKKVYMLSPLERKIIGLCLMGKIPESAVEYLPGLSARYGEIKKIYSETLNVVKNILNQERFLSVGTVTLIRAGDRYLALIPDVMTYIQASGRASRLVGNRMTHGFSLIVEFADLKNLVYGLEQRLKAFSRDVRLKHLSDISLSEEDLNIKMSREELGGLQLKYRSILLVVESPTKAKTIARFFGKPSSRKIGDVSVYSIPIKVDDEIVEFNIVATRGHIYDLTVDNKTGLYGVVLDRSIVVPVYSTIRKCRLCGTQFVDHEKCPKCGNYMYSDSKYIIAVLRKLATEVEEIYVATDPDLEGEKIAYDVYVTLYPFNKSIWRIELHEITLPELLKAIKQKRCIDKRLVEAEMYRRVLDRLVGFALSYRLQSTYGYKYLGAGRVQTPVLGLIIEKYREHLAKKCKKVIINTGEPVKLSFSLYLDDQQIALVEKLKNAQELVLAKHSEELIEVQPKPPYTTDELLADASKHGIPVETAMRIAQDLFEAGLITYHRTDCTYVSLTGIGVAAEYLSARGLREYFRPSHWGAPGTHEAIRPVYPLDSESLLQAIEEGVIPLAIPLTGLHLKLYDLIFKRFITSQMKPFKATKAKFFIVFGGNVLGEIEVYTDIVEKGFNLVEPIKIYNILKGRDSVNVKIIDVKVVNSSKAALYSSGDVVLLMKRLSIGRPSTYSKILSSIKRHGYIVESKVKKKLIPTKRGIEIYEFLTKHYPELVSIEVTRKMETVIDMISKGEVEGREAIQGVLLSLTALGLLEPALVLSLNLDGDVRLDLTFNNIATN